MLRWFNRRFERIRSKKGQGMTEYIIIVALIAIAAIVVIKLFGKTIQGSFADMAKRLSGKASEKKADAAATETGAAVAEKDLDEYGDR